MNIRAILLAGMLLLATIAGGPGVGTAAAAEAGQCSDLDDFIMFASLGLVNSDSCSRQAYVDAAIQDMQESDANQTHVDLYSSGLSQRTLVDSNLVTYENYLQDTESTAWSKMQVAIAEAYANGSSKAEAKNAAADAIADYYAVKQANLIETWNTSMVGAETISDNAAMEDGMTRDGVLKPAPTGAADQGTLWDVGDSGKEVKMTGGTSTTAVPLVNGSTQDARAIEIEMYWSGWSSRDTGTFSFSSGSVMHNDQSSDTKEFTHLMLRPPSDSYEVKKYVNVSRFKELNAEIESQVSSLQDESGMFVESTWTAYQSGEVNASSVIDSHTAMFEYGVRSSNETESLWRSTAALSMMGFSTPNLSASGTMTVSYGGNNFTGLVMARNAPNGSWSAGSTYNTSNITGPVFLLTTDGQKVDFADGETFTISALTAKDGSEIESVNTTRYNYKTADSSELIALQQQLTELRQEIEDREATIGGGGSSGPGLGNTEMIGLGAIAALLAVILLRD